MPVHKIIPIGRFYWADAKLKQISSADYEGRDLRIVLQSVDVLRHPFSLSIFEDRLYWTDWDTEGVHSANKFSGTGLQDITGGLYGPMTVRVFHAQSQPELPDKCAEHPCSHLCLPTPVFAPRLSAYADVRGRR